MAKIAVPSKRDVLEEYRALVAASPESAEAQTNLAWGYYGSGDHDEAVRQFEKALELDPQSFEAHFGLALTLKKSGVVQRALESFEQAARLAAALDDKDRADMLVRMIHGHINVTRSGEWQVGRELWQHKPPSRK